MQSLEAMSNSAENIHSLFLSAWYPNRHDAMSGLFVRKHAEAVSKFCMVSVLYVQGDVNIKKIEIVNQRINQNTREIIVYFPEKSSGIFRKFIKFINYLSANFVGYKEVIRSLGKPDIVHVNILTRTALLAYWLNKTKNIPYVITEHWTRYLPLNNSYKGLFRKLITETIVRNSEMVMPVSEQLKNAMLQNGLNQSSYKVINNVVDDYFYSLKSIEKKNELKKKSFLHVSCFIEKAKNVKGLLNAIKSLTQTRDDFELTIIGYGPDYEDVLNYTRKLKLPQTIVRFTGEKTPKEVASFFYESDVFVLFSNYETAGVVIAESLAIGVPVVSTKVGIATDYINSDNGILVDVGDEKALVEAMGFMLDHLESFDRNKIRKQGEIFCYERVGKEIFSIYTSVLNK